MSYPCNECGITKDWSIFSDDNKIIGYDVCGTFGHGMHELDGSHVIEYYPINDRNYEVVLRVWQNGSGKTEFMEKLK